MIFLDHMLLLMDTDTSGDTEKNQGSDYRPITAVPVSFLTHYALPSGKVSQVKMPLPSIFRGWQRQTLMQKVVRTIAVNNRHRTNPE